MTTTTMTIQSTDISPRCFAGLLPRVTQPVSRSRCSRHAEVSGRPRGGEGAWLQSKSISLAPHSNRVEEHEGMSGLMRPACTGSTRFRCASRSSERGKRSDD
jgi:hypothetical protein